MVYVTVKEQSDERLHLSREPTLRSWSILIGILSLGLGAAYYSNDWLLWKVAYVLGATCVGVSCMEEWEDCIFDKISGKVTFRKFSVIQMLFGQTDQRAVVTNISDIVDVTIDSQDVKYGANGHQVVLGFSSGYSLGVTETVTVGDKSEHENIAENIKQFLELDKKSHAEGGGSVSQGEGDAGKVEDEEADRYDDTSSSSDDGFVQISKEELGDVIKPDDKKL